MYTSLARHLAILHRHNQRYLNQVLKPYSLTSGEVGFLMSLYQAEGQTQEELSTALVIDKAATARAMSPEPRMRRTNGATASTSPNTPKLWKQSLPTGCASGTWT